MYLAGMARSATPLFTSSHNGRQRYSHNRCPLGNNGAMTGSVIASQDANGTVSCRARKALYWPAQVTLSFQSMNEPFGLLRQAQT
jgi:hypothetical protein